METEALTQLPSAEFLDSVGLVNVASSHTPVHSADAAMAASAGLATNRRILIVDDNPAIHEDFRKVLGDDGRVHEPKLLAAEAALFGEEAAGPVVTHKFEIDSAHQGQEALQKVQQAMAAGRPYAMAFVDVRMPPGWDGIETTTRLWQVCPDLQVVICTAYSDYSWDEVIARLGASDNLVILKKPFDNVEVLQLAHAFTRKWELNCQARLKVDELRRMVEERTRELQAANAELTREMQERIQLEKQFRQAQKMEAIGQLAAGVAHDFNNMLTVMHGHVSMLLMRLGEEGPHAKSLLEIRNSAERAASLVRQLLAFSRKQILQFRNVDLGEVVRSVSGMIQQLVGEHVEVVTDCAPGVGAIYADRGMIEQVIMNLSVNARDAVGRGGRVTLRVSAVHIDNVEAPANQDARPGDFVCLAVADDGCGMNQQVLSHLFEPFFTTKEVGKGSGLGLATVYGIVRQHQGWVEVQSQVGIGSTFQVFFPVSNHAAQSRQDAKRDPVQRKGNETILVAEDETPLREMVTDVLSLQGYRVLSANSGPKALELYQQEKRAIDLLLTDVVMPGGMMGTDLAAELKRSNPDLRVIYTTGYSPGVTGVQDQFLEGVNFLPKPYPPHKLSGLVRRCLDS